MNVRQCAAVPDTRWVEFFPQLDDLTTCRIRIEVGYAIPPETPGIGIKSDWNRIEVLQLFTPLIVA